jgi:biotin-dependent carboxylase-like uncharacterized protein
MPGDAVADRAGSFRGLEVLATGPLSLVQDLGRPGLASVGVGRSGAADRTAFRHGAVLAGNSSTCAAIEVLLGGLRVRAHGDLTMAVTGARMPVTVNGENVYTARAFPVLEGATVVLGSARAGLRGYLSVRGGIAVPPVLGSRSTDTLARLGPARLRGGDLLPVGPPSGLPAEMRPSPASAPPPAAQLVEGAPDSCGNAGTATTVESIALDVVRGPRSDWFADPDVLVRTDWVMTPHSNRVGLRLTGGVLERAPAKAGVELPSEGMVLGCLQVPPNGEPVLLMPDHPVTGGYPVIGVVTDAGMDLAAQARPGRRIRFRWRAETVQL